MLSQVYLDSSDDWRITFSSLETASTPENNLVKNKNKNKKQKQLHNLY